MKKIIDRINQATGNSFDILQLTMKRIGEERVAEASASMAYYGFFSLFPLLLVIIAVVSTVLEDTTNQEQILELLLQAFPFSSDLIEENIRQVLISRRSVGLIGLVGLAWSAMGGFTVLTRNINRAWPQAKARNFIKMKLVSFAMLAAMIIGLIALFILNTILRFLPQDINEVAEKVSSQQSFSDLLMGVSLFLVLYFCYWWIPRTKVRWQESGYGALLSAIIISILTKLFTWYLGSGLSSYNLVYGSLGAIVALLFWIYMVSLIIFAGAHLGAAMAHIQRNPDDVTEAT
jgi:membrane protein